MKDYKFTLVFRFYDRATYKVESAAGLYFIILKEGSCGSEDTTSDYIHPNRPLPEELLIAFRNWLDANSG